MTSLELAQWSGQGLDLLRRQNSAEMTEHLGGPETAEQLRRRHERYLSLADGRMFLVVLDDQVVGSVGYWTREWNGEQVYETGYGILPEYQGRGFAAEALRLCAQRAARDGSHAWLHAFPSVHHEASNAVCRKAGFELVGPCEFEYPPGHAIRSNDWRLALTRPDAH
ncbi:GNAT family N-acetyltransferase [Streptomyces sp. 5-8]|uniref:GNAT family N-acetyltransferase n=1 Tax=Streptomyces musisoli TaxID=2802280 RepID=A0ABS1PC86_9ACTN|nr:MULTISPECIES: GNAT family N-acetyltransferase [Streptomyces]MBL1109982.1 GNAT family N-acetyltransferase [Streptomyces musisoli]MBY8841397.1 GNAT family N-acetyltransferase [Streptomyces sp. SP2-10]